MLTKIRGVQNVEEEFQDIITACKVSNSVKNPWGNLFFKRSFRPQLFIAFTATFFQQWTGINTVIFYAPQLFIILGTGQSAALAATIVTGRPSQPRRYSRQFKSLQASECLFTKAMRSVLPVSGVRLHTLKRAWKPIVWQYIFWTKPLSSSFFRLCRFARCAAANSQQLKLFILTKLIGK